VIWVQGVTDGGSLGQLVTDREQADEFVARLDALSSKPIVWTFVPVQSRDSRDAHAEAQKLLQEIS